MTAKWTLPPPRLVAWELKPLSSASMTLSILGDGRLELTITHAVLHGVTPTMLKWWFGHVVGTMEYMGQVYPRYLVCLANRFTAVSEGTQYFTHMVWGSPAWFGKLVFNRLIRPRIFSNEMARGWLRHHVEEIGNLEKFLPALYSQHGQHAENT